jgi:hypothetical protein
MEDETRSILHSCSALTVEDEKFDTGLERFLFVYSMCGYIVTM